MHLHSVAWLATPFFRSLSCKFVSRDGKNWLLCEIGDIFTYKITESSNVITYTIEPSNPCNLRRLLIIIV